MSDEKKLRILDDLVLSELLAMSDEELLRLASADEIEAIRKRLEAATAQAAKIRLGRARAAIAADRTRAPPAPLGGRRASLGTVRRSDPTFDKKLTLAARNAGADFQADEASIEEDLAELEDWEDEDEKKS